MRPFDCWCRRAERASLRGFFAAFFFGFLLLCFELIFELFALLSLDFVAFLALDLKLFFGAEQFDDCLFGTVALLETNAHNAQIASLTIAVAGRNRIEKSRDCLVGHEEAERLAARVEIALFAEGDHLFDVRADRLGLGNGGLDAVFYDDGRDQIAQQSATVTGVASELESCIAMAHDVKLAFEKISLKLLALSLHLSAHSAISDVGTNS